jgi:hypothetical protein
MPRIRIVMLSTLAVLALSAVAAGAASAEPTYWHLNAALAAGESLGVRYTSMWSRLWVASPKLVITCERDKGTGTIKASGEDTVASGLAYTGCKPFEWKENATTTQLEEGAEFSKCTVSGGTGAAAGEIKLPALKSQLVYKVGSTKTQLLVRLEPEVGENFVTIKLSGAECALAGEDETKGKVLGWVPRVNEEAIMGNVLFETLNAAGAIKQRFREYELGGVTTTGVELKFGTHVAAYESTEQIELEPIGGKRGLFDAHT